MPRELGDVLDYFLPAAGRGSAASEEAPAAPFVASVEPKRPGRPERLAALPIVSIPIGECDVLRAAFAWNLTVELARLGASATLLTPPGADALWPEAGRGPVGAERRVTDAEDIGALNRAALDVAVTRAADLRPGDSGIVLVRVPPDWLTRPEDARALLRRMMLFSAAERRDLMHTYALAKRIFATQNHACVGVTIHGTRRISDAESAFLHLADVTSRHLGRELVSYGLLLDDLHIYRAIVARRPIGLEHPQSRAARALRDVARLLLDDTRSRAVA